eukprot:1449866-Amphidinium_carterae.2
MGSVASLGKRPILLGSDWNFEPDDFPIDLVHGATVQRPLVATRPPPPLWRMERTQRTIDGTKSEVARARKDFKGWAAGLSTSAYRQLKLESTA